MIDAEHYKKIDEIFQAALELRPDERTSYISEACEGDESLIKEVEALLASDEREWEILNLDAFEMAAPLLAKEQPELLSEQRLGHYRIVSLLGAGGMGQVYLAEDTRLNRKVALKLLPKSYTNDASRLRRFQQEARAASALNHPNILTIYDIWEIENRHIIVTEYIEGETLRQRMKREKVSVEEAIDISIQVASALWAAHQAGIIHRDIKPENIMLRSDGLIKVLDFGLAKLLESRTASITNEPTTTNQGTQAQLAAGQSNTEGGNSINTEAGLLMGTLPYMSPEQLKGEPLDARTDIYSFAVMVYEMVTGSQPFEAPTNNELIASILNDEPQPLPQTISVQSSKLQDIVSKSLRKERAERYQTSGELLADLKRLMEQFGQLSASSPTSWIKRHNIVLVLAILIISAAATIFTLSRMNRKSAAPFQNTKITRLTSHGSALDTAISPDGKYVVYGRNDSGKAGIWLKEVGANSEVEVAAVTEGEFYTAVFTPDSKQIYYTIAIPDARTKLYQIPVSGGSAKELPTQRVVVFCFSPDGKRFAYVYNGNEKGETILKTVNADGTDERDIIKWQAPNYFGNIVISWSPDGRIIAVGGHREDFSGIFEVNVEEGAAKPIPTAKWRARGIAWLPDMSGLIFNAAEESLNNTQIWHVPYPGGEPRRITNDVASYEDISLTSDGKTLVTMQTETTSRIFVIPVEGNAESLKTSGGLSIDTSLARQIGSNKSYMNSGPNGNIGLCWTPDGRILYESDESGNTDIWIMDADGSNPKQLTTDPHSDSRPSVTPDGRYIVFKSNRTGQHIWRMDIDGRNEQQLTNGHVEDDPLCSGDGKWVIYTTWETGKMTISKVPIEGGEPVPLTETTSSLDAISPDGKLMAYSFPDEQTKQFKIGVRGIEGGSPIKIFDDPSIIEIQWSPNEQVLTFLSSKNNVSNIWLVPLGRGQPRQLTNFTSDGILSYSFSHDGKQLVCRRGTESKDVVLIKDLR